MTKSQGEQASPRVIGCRAQNVRSRQEEVWIQARVPGQGARNLQLWVGEEWTPAESLLGAHASPTTQNNCPSPNPWVLTAFSVPLNRMPVECGCGGSGGATGGGRRGGSSLLPRHRGGFTTGRGSLGPESRVKSRASLSRTQQVTGPRYPFPESRTHTHGHLEMSEGRNGQGHKHAPHSPRTVPLTP